MSCKCFFFGMSIVNELTKESINHALKRWRMISGNCDVPIYYIIYLYMEYIYSEFGTFENRNLQDTGSSTIYSLGDFFRVLFIK